MKIRSATTLPRKILTCLAIAIAIGALDACSNGSTASTDAAAATTHPSPPAQVASSAPSSSAAEFPAGTEVGDLGLPVYPTPSEHVSPHDVGTNGDGEKYDSVLLEPHDPFDTVLAWYKAHMPTGSFVASPNPKHAEFHIGDADKITRMVIIDNIHEGQTHLILMMKTRP
jgi:hypothetical protein